MAARSPGFASSRVLHAPRHCDRKQTRASKMVSADVDAGLGVISGSVVILVVEAFWV